MNEAEIARKMSRNRARCREVTIITRPCYVIRPDVQVKDKLLGRTSRQTTALTCCVICLSSLKKSWHVFGIIMGLPHFVLTWEQSCSAYTNTKAGHTVIIWMWCVITVISGLCLISSLCCGFPSPSIRRCGFCSFSCLSSVSCSSLVVGFGHGARRRSYTIITLN